MDHASWQNNISILLSNRSYLYRLMQNLFGNEPTTEAISILCSNHTKTCLALLSIEKGYESINRFALQIEADEKETMDKTLSEYTRLFIGPAKLAAPPWESVYVSKDKILFQECTLKVRQCYLVYNFVPVNFRSEADDHLGLELDFMANLSLLAENALAEDKMDDLGQILKDQATFIQEHLQEWVPQYTSDLEAATGNHLYQGLASLLKEFIIVDLAVIQEIMNTI